MAQEEKKYAQSSSKMKNDLSSNLVIISARIKPEH